MTHITLGKIILNTDKNKTPWIDSDQQNNCPRTLPTFNRQQQNRRGKTELTIMVSSCDAIFVEVYIIWTKTAPKNVIYIHIKSLFFNRPSCADQKLRV